MDPFRKSILAASVLSIAAATTAHAVPFTTTLLSSGALQFAVLGSAGPGKQLNYNNGNIIGDVGVGTGRQFTISNANLTGNLRFQGPANYTGMGSPPGPCPNVSGGGCFSGAIIANDPVVGNALSTASSLSQSLGAEAGTSISITSGGSINASSGTLDANGNRVFSVSSVSFPNGTFTVNGSAGDYVVLNIGSSANLHGQILLAGGITSDHVLINMFGGNYTTGTGGPTLDVNTNGLSTFGIFLDPNGAISAVHTDIQGRLFGGATDQNIQIVSGANITAPATTVPEPATLSLMATGLFGLVGVRRRTRRRTGGAELAAV